METVFLENHDHEHTSGYAICEQGRADLVVTQVPLGLSHHHVTATVNATTINWYSQRRTEVPWSRLGRGKVISIF